MNRIHRPLLWAAAVALLAVPAFAGPTSLGPGDAAVDFEGKEFVNTEPVSLRGLRGRIVLLELFSTT